MQTWVEVPSNGIYCLQLSPESNNDVGTLTSHGANERNPEPVECSLTNNERLTLYPWLQKCCKESQGISNIAGHDVKSTINPEIGSLTERYGTIGIHSGILPLNNTLEGNCGSWSETAHRTTQDHNSANSYAEGVNTGPEPLLEYADEEQKKTAQELISVLGESVRIRVEAQSDFCSMCLQERLSSARNMKHHKITKGAAADMHVPKPLPSGRIGCGHARTAVLFSGGIDSLVLAALADRCVKLLRYRCRICDRVSTDFNVHTVATAVMFNFTTWLVVIENLFWSLKRNTCCVEAFENPLLLLSFRYVDPEEPIDLLNVAFEQQRAHQSKFQKRNKQEAETK